MILFCDLLIQGWGNTGYFFEYNDEVGMGFITYAFCDRFYGIIPVFGCIHQSELRLPDPVFINKSPEILTIGVIDYLGDIPGVRTD